MANPATATPSAQALREYQSKRQLKLTEVMDAPTLARLIDDSDLMERLNVTNAIMLLGDASPLWTEYAGHEMMRVEGTWVITNETSARPLQTSDIRCIRQTGTCAETTVFIDSSGGAISTLRTEYRITSWDTHGLRAAASSASCADYIMHVRRIDKNTREHIPGLVTGHRVVKAGGQDLFGKACEVGMSPHLSLRLDRGLEVQQRYRSELWKALGFPSKKEDLKDR